MCSTIWVATIRIFAVTNPQAPIDVAPSITPMVATRRAELHCSWSTFNNVLGLGLGPGGPGPRPGGLGDWFLVGLRLGELCGELGVGIFCGNPAHPSRCPGHAQTCANANARRRTHALRVSHFHREGPGTFPMSQRLPYSLSPATHFSPFLPSLCSLGQPQSALSLACATTETRSLTLQLQHSKSHPEAQKNKVYEAHHRLSTKSSHNTVDRGGGICRDL